MQTIKIQIIMHMRGSDKSLGCYVENQCVTHLFAKPSEPSLFNLFIPAFLKLALPSLKLDVSIF